MSVCHPAALRNQLVLPFSTSFISSPKFNSLLTSAVCRILFYCCIF
nr:MAG TPA: hypothetical protein [Caudoviricetes sp.]